MVCVRQWHALVYAGPRCSLESALLGQFAAIDALDLPIRNRGTLEISPDGSRLAILEKGATTVDIWIYELANGRATKLTTDGLNDGPIFWSPDGASVFYQKSFGSKWITYRKLIGSQLAGEPALHDGGDDYDAVSISADGRFMGLQGIADKVGIGVYDVSAKKVIPVPSARWEDWGTAISPDGRAIAYTSSSSGAYHIYIQPVPANGRPTRAKSSPHRTRTVQSALA